MTEDIISQLLALPHEERLQLSQLLWESLDPSAISDEPLVRADRELLEARMDAYDADPSMASAWPDVRRRIGESLAAIRKR